MTFTIHSRSLLIALFGRSQMISY